VVAGALNKAWDEEAIDRDCGRENAMYDRAARLFFYQPMIYGKCMNAHMLKGEDVGLGTQAVARAAWRG